MDDQTGSYKTLDNGGNPFRVKILPEKIVLVWKNEEEGEQFCLQLRASKIFIGMSPLNECTKSSGGHGPEWNGNSIILQGIGDENTNEYWFIGWEIFRFRTLAPIIYYTSPVGNSGVSYPWAQDVKGNFYLMCDGTVFTKLSHELAVDAPISVKEQYDPYFPCWFKEQEGGLYGLLAFKYDHPTTKKVYQLKWCANPEKEFDRLSLPIVRHQRDSYGIDDSLNLGKELWCKLIRDHGERVGIAAFETIEKVEGRM
jgi:hypothetical protein